MEIVPQTEEGSAKVRIGCDRDRQSLNWTRIKLTGTLTNLKARFRTCTGVKQISQASCFSHQREASKPQGRIQWYQSVQLFGAKEWKGRYQSVQLCWFGQSISQFVIERNSAVCRSVRPAHPTFFLAIPESRDDIPVRG
uniref:Uncharacterized protein n=2 Tax=Oryza sativa subsp. japonica TaxID=39947 RepID=Q10IJ7_ORYSJ|nr:hypothetical protein [Oryza sativa Japonica Group]AAO73239.1 hypothetical protein [Oryza sativa Japonica Group]ABF96992.1 hypothetical protein LOC_Os03g34030 [Oryza sativa Japonica Group]